MSRTDQLFIPAAETAAVSSQMNGCLGFAASEAERIFGTNNGETALFWALVETVRQHTMEQEEVSKDE